MRYLRRVRASAGLLLWSCVTAGCLPDFGAIQVVNDAGSNADAARPDAGPDAGPDATSDAGLDAGPDAGSFVPTAIDVPCETTWTELAGGEPNCEGRLVVTVGAPFYARAVAIGRASDGALTVAFNDFDGPDIARLVLVGFDEEAPGSAATLTTIEPEAAVGDVVGFDLAIATERPDTHHLAYWLRSDFGNEIRYRTLRGAALGVVQPLATGVGGAGAVDVALDDANRAIVAWHDDISGATAARREQPDGSWSGRVTIRTDGDPRLEGYGAISLASGVSGEVHAAFQWCITLAASSPSYSVGTLTEWSAARTLDNAAVANRASGVGVDLARAGDLIVVAYLDWTDGLGEVRLARFTSASLEPTVERYLPDIPIVERPGAHPLVIEADSQGWLHLLVATASTRPLETILEYHRQTRIGGELRWIVDTIARLPDVEPEWVAVDMKLGPDRRPHIVYVDPALGVRYATARP